MDAILKSTQIVNLKHAVSTAATPAAGNTTVSDKFMVYSYQGKTPSLSVYENKTQVNASTSNPAYTVKFDATQNTMTINFGTTTPPITNNGKIRIAGEFLAADATAAVT